MAGDRETPFREVPFKVPPPNTYLLRFEGDLTVGDYRTNSEPHFESKMYGKSQNYSQEVFVMNSGAFAQQGVDAIVRYSAPSRAAGIDSDVYALLPSAREKLTLQEIEPIGPDSPPIKIRLFHDQTERLTSEFYCREYPL